MAGDWSRLAMAVDGWSWWMMASTDDGHVRVHQLTEVYPGKNNQQRFYSTSKSIGIKLQTPVFDLMESKYWSNIVKWE